MANWTVATTLERLGEILKEEGLISTDILDVDDDTGEAVKDGAIPLSSVVAVMKDRIVRDQFSPKAKVQHRTRKAEKPEVEA